MTHPRLQSFFTGAVDELRGAYRKSEGAPTPCVGSLRESGVRRAVEHCLPGIVHLYEGEIIDSSGEQSGQLDGILVHSTGAALATAPDDSRVVLAEGAVAVIESKSTLTSQWAEVIRTWEKVRKLRRFKGLRHGVFFGATPPMPGDDALPIVVIGRTGWEQANTLGGKAVELFNSFGAPSAPSVTIVQLDPPGFGAVFWESQTSARKVEVIFAESERWRTLAHVWSILTFAAQSLMATSIDWPGYLQ
jgi:hypothetical protein